MATILNFTGKLVPGQVGATISVGLPTPTPAPTPTPTPDTTAPTITSAITFTQPENAAWSLELTANEAVTWSKRSGADTAEFMLAGAVLSLPAKDFDEAAKTQFVANLRATDAAGNQTDFAVTVNITDVNEDTGGMNALQMGTNLTGLSYVYGPASLQNLMIYEPPRKNGGPSGSDYEGLEAQYFDALGNIIDLPTGTGGGCSFKAKSPGPNKTIRVEWDERADNATVTPDGGMGASAQTVSNGRRSFTFNTGAGGSIYTEGLPIRLAVSGTGGKVFYNYVAYEIGAAAVDGWRQDFIDDLARNFKAFLRYMDMQRTNSVGSLIYTATDRPLPTTLTDVTRRGLSLEQIINLSKLTGSPAWICVPHLADRSWVAKMVELVIAAGITCYVEFMNEIWNNAFPFNVILRKWWTDRHKTTGTETGPDGSFVDALAAQAEKHVEIMTWVKQEAEARGSGVGETAQFRRVLGTQQYGPWISETLLNGNFTAADNSQTFTFEVASNTDLLSPSGYFGDDAVKSPTPTTDLTVIHNRMRADANAMKARLIQHRDIATAKNVGLILYEMNHHILQQAEGVPISNSLIEQITQSEMMRQTMGLALYNIREVDPTAKIGMFSHVGQRYYWFVKHFIDTNRADEPVYDAVLSHVEGNYLLPAGTETPTPTPTPTPPQSIPYTFVEDARGVGATPEPLSARGWSAAGSQARQNGAVRGENSSFGILNGATHAIGSIGMSRKMEVLLDRAGYVPADFPNLLFSLFTGGLGVAISQNDQFMIYRGNDFIANLGGQGVVPRGPATLIAIYDDDTGMVTVTLDGTPVGSPYAYTKGAGDVATAGVAVGSGNLGGKTVYRMLSIGAA